MSKTASVLLCAAALVGCASIERKPLAEVQVRTLAPIINTQLITTVAFKVEEGRIFGTGPLTPGDIDLSVMPDGCLRGDGRHKGIQICATGKPDESGLQQWFSSAIGYYRVGLRNDGAVLEVEIDNRRAEVALGQGAADAELRKHPALLGAAFAMALFPASKNDPASDWDHKEWKYVLTQR